MCATEVIEQIEKLPREEQEQVLAYLQQHHQPSEKSQERQPRFADDSDFEKSTEKIFKEHKDLFRRLAK